MKEMTKTLEAIFAYNSIKRNRIVYGFSGVHDPENWWIHVRPIQDTQLMAIVECRDGNIEYFFRANRSDARYHKCKSIEEALDRMAEKEK